MVMIPARRGRRAVLPSLAASTALLAVLTACGEEGDRLPPPRSPAPAVSVSPAGGPVLTAEEEAAVAEVTAVFDEFMREYIALATSGDPPDVEAIAPLLVRIAFPLEGRVNTELVDNYREDHRLDGDIEWELIEVVEVDLERVVRGEDAPLVELRYCLDYTAWVTVDKENREQLGDPGHRAPAIVRAVLFDALEPTRPGAQWHIYEQEDERGETC